VWTGATTGSCNAVASRPWYDASNRFFPGYREYLFWLQRLSATLPRRAAALRVISRTARGGGWCGNMAVWPGGNSHCHPAARARATASSLLCTLSFTRMLRL
jgi:hypothetical protein